MGYLGVIHALTIFCSGLLRGKASKLIIASLFFFFLYLFSFSFSFTIIIYCYFSPVFRHAHDEFQLVANSWRYSQGYSNKLYFTLVDFDEGPDVFQQVSNCAGTYHGRFIHGYYSVNVHLNTGILKDSAACMFLLE